MRPPSGGSNRGYSQGHGEVARGISNWKETYSNSLLMVCSYDAAETLAQCNIQKPSWIDLCGSRQKGHQLRLGTINRRGEFGTDSRGNHIQD